MLLKMHTRFTLIIYRQSLIDLYYNVDVDYFKECELWNLFAATEKMHYPPSC
jgi:hypothetical protein